MSLYCSIVNVYSIARGDSRSAYNNQLPFNQGTSANDVKTEDRSGVYSIHDIHDIYRISLSLAPQKSITIAPSFHSPHISDTALQYPSSILPSTLPPSSPQSARFPYTSPPKPPGNASSSQSKPFAPPQPASTASPPRSSILPPALCTPSTSSAYPPLSHSSAHR